MWIFLYFTKTSAKAKLTAQLLPKLNRLNEEINKWLPVNSIQVWIHFLETYNLGDMVEEMQIHMACLTKQPCMYSLKFLDALQINMMYSYHDYEYYILKITSSQGLMHAVHQSMQYHRNSDN